MNIVETLQNVAELYFAEGGDAEMLVDEFSDSPEFNAGRLRGHEDAQMILLGLVDHFKELVDG